jgi:hypothetical protein
MSPLASSILTASWFDKLPTDGTPVGISRGVPRGRAGFRRLRELEPGEWFKSVPPGQYLALYRQILVCLDPVDTRARLLAFGDEPVLLCFEHADDVHSGAKWCHRHIVAQWLEDTLGIVVPELGHPQLDRFAYLRARGIEPPQFKKFLPTVSRARTRA